LKDEALEAYIKRRKKEYKEHTDRHNLIIDIGVWKNLILQWGFDFEMDKGKDR
jgi:hypothetical protein